MKTPRCRDSGVSLGKLFLILKSPLAPLFQSGVEDTPQQRLWGIEKSSIKHTVLGEESPVEDYGTIAYFIPAPLDNFSKTRCVCFNEYLPDISPDTQSSLPQSNSYAFFTSAGV